jgi:hypothetical protein
VTSCRIAPQAGPFIFEEIIDHNRSVLSVGGAGRPAAGGDRDIRRDLDFIEVSDGISRPRQAAVNR